MPILPCSFSWLSIAGVSKENTSFSVVVIVFYSVLVFPQIISLRVDVIRSPMTDRKKVVKDARFSYIFWKKSKRDHLIGTVPANIHKIASQFIIYCQRICKGLISALFL